MILWVILLFVAGVALILAEFLIPGMIAGIIGATLVLASGALGIYYYPEHAIMIVIAELVGIVVAVSFGMYLMGRTRISKGLILGSTQQSSAGYVAADGDVALVGAEGTVLTTLRPAGTIMVSGKRLDAVSNGTFIDAGATVRVREVHGSRVVVEKIEQVVERDGEQHN